MSRRPLDLRTILYATVPDTAQPGYPVYTPCTKGRGPFISFLGPLNTTEPTHKQGYNI